MIDKRNPPGRKKVPDPKVSFRVYVNQSMINKLGGYVALQEDVVTYITKKANKVK